ncbi:MAG: endonuclease/exonuclease/phosphatase family protein, partial [Cytophagales bacterium]|nr:endonuclease/exonuclease/phosphatase family protein [Cytophagales bacterium]
NRLNYTADLIIKSDWDIVAVQEMGSSEALKKLLAKMPGWAFDGQNRNANIDVGFLYKKNEFELLGSKSIAGSFTGGRNPREMHVRHRPSGEELYLMAVHLKARGGYENARKNEARQIKIYIDTQRASEKVVVLGDWNDQLTKSTFDIFKDDSRNYRFADMNIALGARENWSYPSWYRSRGQLKHGRYHGHIDHILITNELFEKTKPAATGTYSCETSRYKEYISDHYPVSIQLK